MRLTVVCQDTRGGVQPYAALAHGLAATHDVRAVAPADYAWLFEQVGFRATPCPAWTPTRCARSPWRRRAIAAAG